MAFLTYHQRVGGRPGAPVSAEYAKRIDILKNNPSLYAKLTAERQRYIDNVKKVYFNNPKHTSDHRRLLPPGSELYDERYK